MADKIPLSNYDLLRDREAYRAGVNDGAGQRDPNVGSYTNPPMIKPEPSADPWKHRSQGMRCKTCMWFVAKEPSPALQAHPGQYDLGRCRKHAPTMGGFPAVFVNDWCGDHRIDENKV